MLYLNWMEIQNLKYLVLPVWLYANEYWLYNYMYMYKQNNITEKSASIKMEHFY
jgi:hypothetical protein